MTAEKLAWAATINRYTIVSVLSSNYRCNCASHNRLIDVIMLGRKDTTAVLYCMGNPMPRGGPVCHPGTGAGKDE